MAVINKMSKEKESQKFLMNVKSENPSEKKGQVPIWMEKHITDWLEYLKADKFYTEEQKIVMFNSAIHDMKVDMQEKFPEIKNFTNAREILLAMPTEYQDKFIEYVKVIYANAGEARLTQEVRSMYSKIPKTQ